MTTVPAASAGLTTFLTGTVLGSNSTDSANTGLVRLRRLCASHHDRRDLNGNWLLAVAAPAPTAICRVPRAIAAVCGDADCAAYRAIQVARRPRPGTSTACRGHGHFARADSGVRVGTGDTAARGRLAPENTSSFTAVAFAATPFRTLDRRLRRSPIELTVRHQAHGKLLELAGQPNGRLVWLRARCRCLPVTSTGRQRLCALNGAGTAHSTVVTFHSSRGRMSTRSPCSHAGGTDGKVSCCLTSTEYEGRHHDDDMPGWRGHFTNRSLARLSGNRRCLITCMNNASPR